jgi:hypothetical protein
MGKAKMKISLYLKTDSGNSLKNAMPELELTAGTNAMYFRLTDSEREFSVDLNELKRAIIALQLGAVNL